MIVPTAVVIFFFMSLFILMIQTTNEMLQGLVWVASTLVIVIMSLYYRAKYAHQIEKICVVNRRDAVEIVTAVLEKKQLPHQKIWNGAGYNFHIDGTDALVIEVKDATNNIFSSDVAVGSMSRLRLKAINGHNQPLAHSLQRKLDEAFKPAGLQQSVTKGIDIKFQ